jgi:hypothetical protein
MWLAWMSEEINIQVDKKHMCIIWGMEQEVNKDDNTFEPCLHCAKAKTKQKNMFKESTSHKAEIPEGGSNWTCER